MRKLFLGSCLLFLIIFGGVLMIWLRPDVLPPNNRKVEIDISQLLVTASDFPSGWKADGIPQPASGDEFDWGKENIFSGFHTIDGQGFAYQYVYKFRNEAAAEYGFFWIKQQGYLTPPTNGKVPTKWKYKSSIADEWLFGCSVGSRVCTLLARYDEFIISFDVSINSENMTFDDLEYIIKVIDENISNYLRLNNTTFLIMKPWTAQ